MVGSEAFDERAHECSAHAWLRNKRRGEQLADVAIDVGYAVLRWNIGKITCPGNATSKVPDAAAMEVAFAVACKDLIESYGETAPADNAARIDKVETILSEKRAKTFAIKGFDSKALPSWSEASDQQHEKLTRYLTERASVDEETRRLTKLFSEALALPAVAGGFKA